MPKNLNLLDIFVTFLTISMPFYLLQVTNYNLSVSTVILAISLMLLALSLLKSWEMVIANPAKLFILVMLTGLALWLIMSDIFSPLASTGVSSSVITVSLRMVYFFVPFIYVNDLHKFKRIGTAFLISGLIAALGAILYGTGLVNFEFSRSSTTRLDVSVGTIVRTPGLISNYGDLSIYFSWILGAVILGLFLFEKKHRLSRVFSFISILLILFAELFAQSRNVLVTIAAVFILNLILPRFENGQKYSILLSLTSFLLALVLSMYLIFPREFTDLINSFINLGAGRFEQYRIALDVLASRWLMGLGVGAFQQVYFVLDVHNVLLQILIWGGLIGFLFFAAIIIAPFGQSLKLSLISRQNNPEILRFYILMVVALLLSGFFYPALNSIIFWFSWGLISSIPYLTRQIVVVQTGSGVMVSG